MRQLRHNNISSSGNEKSRKGFKRFRPLARSAALCLASALSITGCAHSRTCMHDHEAEAEAIRIIDLCPEIRDSGVIEAELQKWPQKIIRGISEIVIIPQKLPESVVAAMDLDPETREMIERWRSLLGKILFYEEGDVALRLFYADDISRSTIHHEIAHYIWEKMKPEDKQRAYELLRNERGMKTVSDFIIDVYMKRRFFKLEMKREKLFTRMRIDMLSIYKTIDPKGVEMSLSIFRLNERIEAEKKKGNHDKAKKLLYEKAGLEGKLIEMFDAQHEEFISSLTRLDERIEAEKKKGNHDKAKQLLLEKEVILDDALFRKMTAHTTSMISDSLNELAELCKAFRERDSKNFDEYSDHMNLVIPWLGRIVDQMKALSSKFFDSKTDQLNVKELEDLKDEMEGTFADELFSRAVALVSQGAAFSPEFMEFLKGIELDGEKVFAGLLRSPNTSDEQPLPKIRCLFEF